MTTPAALATYDATYVATGSARAAYRAAFPFASAIENLDRLTQRDGHERFLANLVADLIAETA